MNCAHCGHDGGRLVKDLKVLDEYLEKWKQALSRERGIMSTGVFTYCSCGRQGMGTCDVCKIMASFEEYWSKNGCL